MTTSLSDAGLQFADTSVQRSAASAQINNVSASVAANALSFGWVGGPLQFRNATLTSGVPVISNIGALSLTVPSGATLGTVSALSSRLVEVVYYNGGSPVLGVINLAGGLQLDETNLVSPTTISGTANSASVFYSAAAVSANSPYIVLGFIDITAAVAGTWATAPSLVQGVGGQALTSLSSFGYGQTWQNVTASRSASTVFTNTSGKAIQVAITSVGATTNIVFTFLINGVVIQSSGVQSAGTGIIYVGSTVPHGSTYSLQIASGALSTWLELR